ncbi:phosphodiester glycosidase family protein [Microseira wollei]|uniref:Tat pathway signal sequence domain protein n=1 Tax=Microseira wollei NIES-4236 TaxID=2530354 RepID=A0AAV3XGS5_9CYAN|nr:phosphodiester glycosidase family protein [Microseira wollei]GET39325.1 Tat pathway signal sequence domain protein [Microseira wollei NIES-4236]
MPKPKQSQGCRRMLRRTFLFLIGIAIAQILGDFFSIPKNRDNFFKLVGQLWQKVLAYASTLRSNQTPQPLPSTPVIQPRETPIVSVTPTPSTPVIQPRETPVVSVTPTPSTPVIKPRETPQPSITPTPTSSPLKRSAKKAQPVPVTRNTIAGVSFYQTTIDLTDPEVFLTIGLANNANIANNPKVTKGDEPFENIVARYRAAVIANGTFFGKDAQKSVLGNMVAAGRFLKYSRWENYGTTLGIKAGNQLEMITARLSGQPDWSQYWFSLTCGPRLVKQGKISLSPLSEGFKDSHVLGVGARTAIGFPESRDKLFLVTFLRSLSLEQEAKILQEIGCVEAMNLDGGASVALAHQGRILMSPGRNLTNVLVLYDTNYPAPEELKISWKRFQNGARPSPVEADFYD